ncbi:MAG TPA: sensor domain-containing diguanylate cyclase [Gammaproteobacteria bacterium]|nr:sensor domain-containing diguanylate cyclase [Gammaproteobacteria bacterium]
MGLVGGLLYVVASVSDYQAVGIGPLFWSLLGARCLALLSGVAVCLAARRTYNGPVLAKALFAFEAIIAATFLAVVIGQGGTVDFHTISTIAIVTAYYAFAPTLLGVQLLIPPVLSVGFLAVAAVFLEGGPQALTIPALLLLLVNVFGVQFVRSTNRAQRLERHNLDLQGHLNVQLRQEIDERASAERTARLSEENLRRLFDAAPLPMVLARVRDGAILRTNEAARALFGIREQDQPRLTTRDFYASPVERDHILEHLRRDGQVRGMEVGMRTLEGGELQVLLSASRTEFHGEAANIAGMVDITARKLMEDELHRLANTDPLTGVHNRRFFFDLAEREVPRFIRNKHPVSVLLADIDHFKRVNDTYGHAAGDVVLKGFVAVLKGQLRDYDILGRLGGEEFAIVLPEVSAEAAREAAERLRASVEQAVVRITEGEVKVTVSIGLAGVDANAPTLDAALSLADEALYRAKSLGRNRVEAYTADAPPPTGTGTVRNG